MSPSPQLNIPLLLQTISHLEAHPDQWNPLIDGMRTKDGVVADFAGWATLLHDPTAQPPPARRTRTGEWVPARRWIVGTQWVGSWAATLLGLTAGQTMMLLGPAPSLAQLRAGVDALVLSGGDLTDRELWTAMGL